MTKVFLVGYSGIYTHKEFAVEGDVIIGRNASVSQLVYPGTEKNISGMHCKVQNHGGNITLMDLGSTNGTFLQNGQRLSPNTPYTLQAGVSFYLGDRSNMFTIKVAEEAVPAPSAASIAPQAERQPAYTAPATQANGAGNNKKTTIMIAAAAVVAGIVILVAAISINNTNQAAREATMRAEQEAERARQDAVRAQQELDEEQNKGKVEKTIDAIESWLE